MRILIAEDDPVSRQLLEIRLRNWGYEPVVTSDGPEAWHALRRPDSPSLAIVDWMMPRMDGVDVVRRLRAREEGGTPEKYFILVTARERVEDVLLGFEAGADDYLTKPFDLEELHARIRVGARMIDLRRKLAGRIEELERALSKVTTLQGLLPICSYCKKIRDDQNYWTEVESYFEKVSDAEFSHGVCPDCVERHLRPRLDRMKEDG